MSKLDWHMVDRYFDGTATRTERVRVIWLITSSSAFRELCGKLYGWVDPRPPKRRKRKDNGCGA